MTRRRGPRRRTELELAKPVADKVFQEPPTPVLDYLSSEALSFRYHHRAISWALNGHSLNDDYFEKEALDTHALTVVDAVSDLRVRAIQSAHLFSSGARDHLLYGVGRRTGDIWGALRELIGICRVTRTSPLSLDEVDSASRALNSIYINVRGTLDNFAWAVVEEAGGLESAGLAPASVDIFGERFRRVVSFRRVVKEIDHLRPWALDLKERRNPAAHRIPLAVVPAELTAEEAEEYTRLTSIVFAEHFDKPLTLADVQLIREDQERRSRSVQTLGRFRPMFAHMPSEGFMPIYPTVPEDVGSMVQIGRIVLEIIGNGRLD